MEHLTSLSKGPDNVFKDQINEREPDVANKNILLIMLHCRQKLKTIKPRKINVVCKDKYCMTLLHELSRVDKFVDTGRRKLVAKG